jgi:hypothetical protein
MNIPTTVAKHIKNGLIVTDSGTSAVSAETRMTYATERIEKAKKYLESEDFEGAGTFCESAIVIAFEAWLMYNHLKFTTSEGSHKAAIDFIVWLAKRENISIEPSALYDLVANRQRILYNPWDIKTNQESVQKWVDLATVVVEMLVKFPKIKDENQ